VERHHRSARRRRRCERADPKNLTVAYGQITVRVLLGTVTGPITVVTPAGKGKGKSKKSFTVT
jgi:hypothetical protein